MGWFSKATPEPEWTEPTFVRLASDEFISGLVEIAEIYERREKASRAQVVAIATRLTARTYFNFGDLDRSLGETRAAISDAFDNMAAASEIRGWIRQYKCQGRRPPYLPVAPQTDPPQGGN